MTVFCLQVITPQAACQAASQTLPPTVVPAGDHWMRVDYFVPTSASLQSAFFPFTVQGTPPEPVLSSTTGAVRGQALLLNLSHPGQPGAFYIAAVSLTTNAGIPLGNVGHLALDNDLLLQLSFPTPDPVIFFNMQSTLDISGNASGIGLFIPNVSFLQCNGLAFQAAVLGSSGIELSNALTSTVQ